MQDGAESTRFWAGRRASTYAGDVEACPVCGHPAKVPHLSLVDRIWGLRPYCPVRVDESEHLRPVCGCTNAWHVAGT